MGQSGGTHVINQLTTDRGNYNDDKMNIIDKELARYDW